MNGPIRVVIADDDDTMRETLRDLLAAADGVEVAGVAVDATTAIDQCARAQPDVVLLDVGMPGGGVDAAGTIRRQHPEVAILALTADDDDRTRSAMLEAGASAVLIKGLRRRALLEAIHAVGRRASSHRQGPRHPRP